MRKILLEQKDVKEGLRAVDELRNSSPALAIPRDVETRWIGCFNALDFVCARRMEILADEHMPRANFET